MNFFKAHKKLSISLSLVLVFLLGIGLSFVSPNVFSRKDKQFETFTEALFKEQIKTNTLNMHYTLANPEAFGIDHYPITLGTVSINDDDEIASLENFKQTLATFEKSNLSEKNNITLDMLNLYIETELSSREFGLLNELLSPTLGIQAQLPVLLAEYTFRTKTDIQDYLKLLTTIDTYFQDIMNVEQKKAKEGYFMSTQAADNIISQCSSFIKNPSNNYLITVFNKKIQAINNLTEEEKQAYIQKNEEIIKSHVIPAYQLMIDGLDELKSSSVNQDGLFYLESGKSYYEYLIKSNTGVYDSMDQIRLRLITQLTKDYKEMRQLLLEDSSLLTQQGPSTPLPETPEKMLENLRTVMVDDFPKLADATYEVKEVDGSLADYLSPAFYLTPPIDDCSINPIYVNPTANLKGLDLYTTLAHEGFPGHLYQTLYFNQTAPDNIRSIFSNGGYVEGWATYVESYAYEYGSPDSKYGRLMWLNRSLNLNLCSLIDMGVHYYGWKEPQCEYFLRQFGITDAAQVQQLYQNVVETPSNYLKYYLGYLNFEDLKEDMQEKEGEQFDLKEFHKKVLEIGPVQFPVLRAYLGLN